MIKLKGQLLFTDKTNGFSAKLVISEQELEKLDKYCQEENENEVKVKEYVDEETGARTYGINIKSRFDFPLWDKNGNKLDKNLYELYDKAEVIVSLKTKDIVYKDGRRSFKYCVCFINGMVLLKDGQAYEGVSFEDMMKDEDLQF